MAGVAAAAGAARSVVHVRAQQLVHQNARVFARARRHDPDLSAALHVAARCGVKAGPGRFLFTGRMRLGTPTLRCAPYFKDWLKVAHRAECSYS